MLYVSKIIEIAFGVFFHSHVRGLQSISYCWLIWFKRWIDSIIIGSCCVEMIKFNMQDIYQLITYPNKML
jgi:hypothetical protein